MPKRCRTQQHPQLQNLGHPACLHQPQPSGFGSRHPKPQRMGAATQTTSPSPAAAGDRPPRSSSDPCATQTSLGPAPRCSQTLFFPLPALPKPDSLASGLSAPAVAPPLHRVSFVLQGFFFWDAAVGSEALWGNAAPRHHLRLRVLRWAALHVRAGLGRKGKKCCGGSFCTSSRSVSKRKGLLRKEETFPCKSDPPE